MTDLFIVLLYTFLTASKLLNVVHIVSFIILIIWILYIATKMYIVYYLYYTDGHVCALEGYPTNVIDLRSSHIRIRFRIDFILKYVCGLLFNLLISNKFF